MKPDISVVVAGHICLDLIPTLPKALGAEALLPGHLFQIGPAQVSTGGPVSNTGLALHKLGIPVRLVAKVGEDVLGTAVRDILQQYDPSIVSGIVSDPSTGTSYSVIISSPGVDRSFWHYPGANDTFCAGDIPFELVADASLFHFGYPPIMRRIYADEGAELVEIFRRAKVVQTTTSLDMCVPDAHSETGRIDWRAIYRAVLPYVDIFLPSVDELLFTLCRAEFDRLSRTGSLLDAVTPELLADMSAELMDFGVKVVVIKLGYRGLYLRSACAEALASMGRGSPANPDGWSRRQMWAPCFQAQVMGTTGSGDATIAGFLAAWLRGLGAAETMTAAVAVGACNVEAADAISGIRSWQETMARVVSGWPRHSMSLASYQWNWHDPPGIWVAPDSPL